MSALKNVGKKTRHGLQERMIVSAEMAITEIIMAIAYPDNKLFIEKEKIWRK